MSDEVKILEFQIEVAFSKVKKYSLYIYRIMDELIKQCHSNRGDMVLVAIISEMEQNHQYSMKFIQNLNTMTNREFTSAMGHALTYATRLFHYGKLRNGSEIGKMHTYDNAPRKVYTMMMTTIQLYPLMYTHSPETGERKYALNKSVAIISSMLKDIIYDSVDMLFSDTPSMDVHPLTSENISRRNRSTERNIEHRSAISRQIPSRHSRKPNYLDSQVSNISTTTRTTRATRAMRESMVSQTTRATNRPKYGKSVRDRGRDREREREHEHGHEQKWDESQQRSPVPSQSSRIFAASDVLSTISAQPNAMNFRLTK